MVLRLGWSRRIRGTCRLCDRTGFFPVGFSPISHRRASIGGLKAGHAARSGFEPSVGFQLTNRKDFAPEENALPPGNCLHMVARELSIEHVGAVPVQRTTMKWGWKEKIRVLTAHERPRLETRRSSSKAWISPCLCLDMRMVNGQNSANNLPLQSPTLNVSIRGWAGSWCYQKELAKKANGGDPRLAMP
ncbi:hypothetical protein AXG93_1487s1000 [Marchantia polymorpha subsp. ruderalis]|uniref:Uncharacterized protein n=1 Tax=Marchantia polymorpha subsp. ruderalis TaxID=1480154 RepID=A0A176WPV9_MARPO|nr:hypothetical protein AXG93_1487s1000 [Marchantia polymorpha subsp. ruderalis]